MVINNKTEILIILGVILVGYLIWINRERVLGVIKGVSSATPILDMYSRDLTAQARNGELDPVINRKKEIARVIQILSRRTKNNPILLGEAGVGKTAIAEGLAQRIVNGQVPGSLRNKRVLAINVSGLIAGTKYRGEFEQRLRKIMEEIRKSKRQIILFIDEIHTLLEAKGAEGAMDPSDILKPPLARGDLQAIGATTLTEYKKYIKPDESLERRFQPISVAPPNIKMTIEILKGIAPVYERHHKIKYTLEALKAAAVLSEKYIKDRFLPDKAIDLIDEAAAKVRLKTISISDQIKNLEREITRLNENKKFVTNERKRWEIDEKIIKKKERIERLRIIQEEDKKGIKRPLVGVEDIKEIISEWVNIPKDKIENNLSIK